MKCCSLFLILQAGVQLNQRINLRGSAGWLLDPKALAEVRREYPWPAAFCRASTGEGIRRINIKPAGPGWGPVRKPLFGYTNLSVPVFSLLRTGS